VEVAFRISHKVSELALELFILDEDEAVGISFVPLGNARIGLAIEGTNDEPLFSDKQKKQTFLISQLFMEFFAGGEGSVMSENDLSFFPVKVVDVLLQKGSQLGIFIVRIFFLFAGFWSRVRNMSIFVRFLRSR